VITERQPHHSQATAEELTAALAAGRQEAVAELYERYARLVFALASRSLDCTAAEEIVQDVFVEVWRRASSFDPQQGAFRPWLLQLTHWRILNELRRRTRRPRVGGGLEFDDLSEPPDPSPPPEDVAAQLEREDALRAALSALPEPQREALGLAFFGELTHEQVASRLQLPLGTAKTRIRAGVLSLRASLGPVAAALLALVAFGTLAVHDLLTRAALDRDERAVALLTVSEIPDRRLAPVGPGLPANAHGHYRGRAGVSLAVFNVTDLPVPPAGHTYQAWVAHQGRWASLGTLALDETGSGRLIAESADLAVAPAAVEVTLEPAAGSPTPSGPVVLAWP
jgi:RNA polymerase sigma-70 factor (ECF subfamily)